MLLQHLHVSCAVIEKNRRVLCAQRSAFMSMPLKWEFPGGKIDNEETPEGCVIRECLEELDISVTIKSSMTPCTWKYSASIVTLYPFICTVEETAIQLREHAAVTWLFPDDLKRLDWADADIPVVKQYCKML